MASLPSDGTDDLLFEMYKKEVLKNLISKMDHDMLKTLEMLKCGGVGTSDLGISKMRLETFLRSTVSGQVANVGDFSEKSLPDLYSRLEASFGNVFSNEIISGIAGVLASNCSITPSINEGNEKLVVDLLRFLVEASCIKMKGSEFVTPCLKRKIASIANSPAAPVKRVSKTFDPNQLACNIDAKVLFPEVDIIEVHSKANKGLIKDIQIDSDVVFLKEVTLNEKLNKMCKTSEAYHNKHNVNVSKVQARATSAIDIENNVQVGATTTMNVLSPSVSVVSDDGRNGVVGFVSIPESSKFPLTAQEKVVYNAICSLANSKHTSSNVATIGSCNVTYFSLGESMAPEKEVCTFVVNALCRKYFLDERPTISRKHYFFSVVGEAFLSELVDYSHAQKSFAGAGSVLPLPLSDSLFFPVVFRKHWFLFVVDLKNKWFMFLDSLYSKQDEFSTHTRNKLIKGFCHAWGKFVGPDTRFNDFRTGYARVPKQENVVDCGIFLIKFMELWWYGCNMVDLFSQEDIPSIRAQISYDIVYCKHNTADIRALNNFISVGNTRG